MADNDKKEQVLNFNFGNLTINGSMFDIHDNTNVYFNNQPCAKPTRSAQSNDIHSALKALMDMTNEQDEPLITKKGQWYAVYKVLSELCNYPKAMTDFVNCLKEWTDPSVRIPLDYDCMRKESQNLGRLTSKNIKEWKDYSDTATQKEKAYIDIAVALMSLLN